MLLSVGIQNDELEVKKSKEEVLFGTEVWKRLRDEDLTGSKPCIICCTII